MELNVVATLHQSRLHSTSSGPGQRRACGLLATHEMQLFFETLVRLQLARQYNWIYPLGDVVSGLIAAGLRLEWLHEHDSVP
jgi:hypothetical protein